MKGLGASDRGSLGSLKFLFRLLSRSKGSLQPGWLCNRKLEMVRPRLNECLLVSRLQTVLQRGVHVGPSYSTVCREYSFFNSSFLVEIVGFSISNTAFGTFGVIKRLFTLFNLITLYFQWRKR